MVADIPLVQLQDLQHRGTNQPIRNQTHFEFEKPVSGRGCFSTRWTHTDDLQLADQRLDYCTVFSFRVIVLNNY